MRLLITGFESFGSVVDNPSKRLANQLSKECVESTDSECLIMDVSYTAAVGTLVRRISESSPDFVLMLGVAGGRRNIWLESRGLNQDNARLPDNDGVERHGPIDPSAKGQIATKVDCLSLAMRLKQLGHRVSVSKDAGGFLCNHVYFRALQHIERTGQATQCLFEHVPPDEWTFNTRPQRSAIVSYDSTLDCLRDLVDLLAVSRVE